MPTECKQASICTLLLISIITSFTPFTGIVGAAKSNPSNIAALEQPPLSGYPIQYTSFAGTTYNLTAYDGLYCRYALPINWTQPGALSTAQLRRLIDLTDLTYALLAEITSGEPQGSGLLTIAVIPTGSAAGHAGSNFKGVELSENELGSVMQHLNSDLLTPETLHELIHNFEIFILQINLGYSDSVHAWTAFMVPFLQYYSRAGVIQSDADAWLQKKITEYTLTWDSTSATWAQCVRNGNACPNISANNAWAGLLLRFSKLHGVNALKRAFRFIRDYAATHPSTGTNPTGPQTREEKNDLLVESLAEGAQQNILCEVDTWHWFATEQARVRISQRFPNSNSFCADNDDDGFSPLLGDTNDTDSQIKPTALERINNLDDDCDLVVDNLLLIEQADFPSSTQSAPTIPIPAKIRGQVTASDRDTFIINQNDSLPRRLRINLQSPNTFVGFIQLQPVDLNGRTQSFSVAGGGAQILTLSRPGLWAITVQNSISITSDYTLSIENAAPPISPVRLRVIPGSDAGTIQVTANIDTTTSAPIPNLIRLWNGSIGIAEPTQLQAQLSFTVPIPPGSGPFSLRAQLLKDDSPITKLTIPLWIDRPTGTMLEQNPDLTITADTFLPSETRIGATNLYGFTITNTGPGLAENIQANIAIPAGLQPLATATTLGTIQFDNNNFRLLINQLAAEESASFSVTTSNVNAQGTITTTAILSSTTSDPVQSNNTASITGIFLGSPSPTPTPTPTPTPVPTPTPSPTPIPNVTIQSLPAKLDNAATRSVLAQGSLARVVLGISENITIQDTYGQQDQNGDWPTMLAGFQVKIGIITTRMIAVTRLPNASPATYAVDFLLPDQAATGNQIPVTITHTQRTTAWTTTATIQPTAPAFWSINGTANGPLLILDGDLLTAIDPTTPIRADNTRRLLIFASGSKTLVAQNTFTISFTCESGNQGMIVHDFVTTLSSLPGIQQIVIRIPNDLAGCGRTRFNITDQQDSEVFLLIQ